MIWVLSMFLAFGVAAVWLSIIDVREHRLPNRGTLVLLLVLIVFAVLAAWSLSDFQALWRSIAAAAVLFAVYLVLNVVYPAGLGMGDVKLAPSVGLALGWVSWSAVWWGSVFAVFSMGLLSLVLLMTRKASMKTALPFGPFMFLGAFIGLAVTVFHVL